MEMQNDVLIVMVSIMVLCVGGILIELWLGRKDKLK